MSWIFDLLAGVYWLMFLARLPALLRHHRDPAIRYFSLTFFGAAVAQSLRIESIERMVDRLVPLPHITVHLSISLFIVALYFVVRLIWAITGTSLARTKLLLIGTVIFLVITQALYFSGIAHVKGYATFTASDLANPWLATYYVLYKLSFLIAIYWMGYYFRKMAISSGDSAFRIRAWFGVVGAICNSIHHGGGVLIHVLGVVRVLTINNFPSAYRVTNSFLAVGAVLTGVALAVPPAWFRVPGRLRRKLQLLNYYHALGGLAARLALIWPAAAQYSHHSSSPVSGFNPLNIEARLHRRIVFISDGIRFLGRFVSSEEYSRLLKDGPASEPPGSLTPPKCLSRILAIAMQRYESGMSIEPLAPCLPLEMPKDTYDNLLMYLVETARHMESEYRPQVLAH